MNNRIFTFQDKNRVSELIELFGTGLGATTEEYWMWRLFSDIGEMNPVAIVCENEQGRLDGMMTAIPAIYGSGETRILQMCDWVVRPEARGQGLISKMYQFITDEYRKLGYDGVSAFANENSKPVVLKYNYKDYGRFSRWSTGFRPFWGKNTTEEIIIKDAKYSFTETCPDFDISVRKKRLYRDQRFLSWKYDQNPETEYTWLSVWKNSLCVGYLVFTLTKGRIRTVVNVYDWDFDERFEAEFAKAITLLCKRGNSVCIWGKYSVKEEQMMSAAGMKKTEIGNPLSVKAFPDKRIPDELILTRVDTDF